MQANKTILFVDDDADFLRSQQAFFSHRGYDVMCAETQADALRLLEDRVPDIIFLDLMMEHYDSGFTLCHRIRQDERLRKVPVVMLSGVAAVTGKGFNQDQKGLQNWPAVDQFVDKPVTGRQLLKIVEERVGSAKAE